MLASFSSYPMISSTGENNNARNWLYIPSSADIAITEFGEGKCLTKELIHDIKIFVGIVYHFTTMRQMEKSRINHEFFKAVLGKSIHYREKGYSIAKKYALKTVVERKDYIEGVRSCVYWIKEEFLDDNVPVPIYTPHPIPIKKTRKQSKDKEKVVALDKFLDEVYIPIMNEKSILDTVKIRGKNLVMENKVDHTLLNKKRFNDRKLHDNLHKIESSKDGLYHTSTDKNGRAYNLLTFLKRELRLVEGCGLSEIDISSSHPHVFGCIMNHFLNKKRTNSKDNFVDRLKKSSAYSEQVKSVLKMINCLNEIVNGKEIKIRKSLIKDDEVFNIIEKCNKETVRVNKGVRLISHNGIYNRYKKFIREGGVFDRNYLEEHLKIDIKYDLIKNKPVIRYSDKNNWLCYTLRGNQELKTEIYNLLKATSDGRFYDFIIEKLGDDWSPFVQNLNVLKDFISEEEMERLKSNPELIEEGYKKRIVKLMVMRWLNDDYAYYSGDDSVENAVFTSMIKVFPILTSIIFILKLNFGKNVFHSMITMVESEFVFDVVKRCNSKTKNHKPFLVGTVHDSFVVKTDKAKHVLEHIKIASVKILGIQCFVKAKMFSDWGCWIV